MNILEERAADQVSHADGAGDDILEQRGRTHGDFADVSRIAQTIKAALRSSPQWERMKPEQKEALERVATKLARCVCGDLTEPDHVFDVTGYCRLYLSSLETDV